MSIEKRCQPRFECAGIAGVHVSLDAEPSPAKILDLSTDGCLLLLEKPQALFADTLIELTFTVNQLPFRVRAQVKAIRSQTSVGFHFPQLSARTRLQLQDLVEELALENQKRNANRALASKIKTARIRAMAVSG